MADAAESVHGRRRNVVNYLFTEKVTRHSSVNTIQWSHSEEMERL